MAESPFYVNVRESRVAKEPEPQYYTNVELVQNNNGQCEEYQIVEERGRDPKGEYTATINSAPDKVTETTLKRQKMLHNLLFPSKTKEKRFNYTDIQLTTTTQEEEEQQAPGPPLAAHPNRSRPQVKPKPKPESVIVEPEESIEQSEDPCVSNETVARKEPSANGSCKVCTWKCTSVLFLVLFVVSVCLSVVAIGVAVTVFIKLPPGCEDGLASSCTIMPEINDGIFTNNTCDTSLEDLGEVLKLSLGLVQCSFSAASSDYFVTAQLRQQGDRYSCHCRVHPPHATDSPTSTAAETELQVNCTMSMSMCNE